MRIPNLKFQRGENAIDQKGAQQDKKKYPDPSEAFLYMLHPVALIQHPFLQIGEVSFQRSEVSDCGHFLRSVDEQKGSQGHPKEHQLVVDDVAPLVVINKKIHID